MRRGEIWRYKPVLERPGQSSARLVVSAEGINRVPELPVVLGLNVLTADPGTLLSVRLGRGAGAPLSPSSRIIDAASAVPLVDL